MKPPRMALVGTTPCAGLHGGEPSRCVRLQVDVLAGDARSERTEFRVLDGGDATIDDIVDVGTGAVVAFSAWHGGALIDLVHVPYAQREQPRELCVPDVHPPIDLTWQESSLFAVGNDPVGDSACVARLWQPLGSPTTPDCSDLGRCVNTRNRICRNSVAFDRLRWGDGPNDRVDLLMPVTDAIEAGV